MAVTVDTSIPVKDMAARHPETKPVFHRFGLDTCCGGTAPIAEAARRDGADLQALVKELQEAMETAAVA